MAISVRTAGQSTSLCAVALEGLAAEAVLGRNLEPCRASPRCRYYFPAPLGWRV